MRFQRPLMGALMVLVGCTTTAPATTSTESIPPVPQAPSGWVSVGAFGGSAGEGRISIALSLAEGPLALSASCAGEGTLMVVVTTEGQEAGGAYVAPAGIFACPGATQVSSGRVELPDASAGAVTVTAYIVEGLGTLRRASFNISMEQVAS